MSQYTEEHKRNALADFIREAQAETSGYPRKYKQPNTPEFEHSGFQTFWMDSLVDALTKTEVLRVLDDWLTEIRDSRGTEKGQ